MKNYKVMVQRITFVTMEVEAKSKDDAIDYVIGIAEVDVSITTTNEAITIAPQEATPCTIQERNEDGDLIS